MMVAPIRRSATMRTPTPRRITQVALTSLIAFAALSLPAPPEADAFCGFYVAGADAQLYNNATMVVLMRDGTRTVLSMQNNYQGPAADFAMVVPVPVVLSENDVKILPNEVFDRVDKLSAPRLVEYWEQDPCAPNIYPSEMMMDMPTSESASPSGGGSPRDLGVTIEAQFEVGEYNVVILSAKESTGLDTWLRQEKYNIPEGAQPLLEPYVQSGSKFFVAKVDGKKVKFNEQGQAMLSPLRFHYDSPEFSLPVRLGLINAQGAQDLLVHILARSVRYELANYDNVAIPTNLDVKNEVRERFGQFYASLFDHTLANNPKAVVTEYSWAAGSCDPCPEPALTLSELVTLGADVLPTYQQAFAGKQVPSEYEWSVPNEFVLTRLHARYDSRSLGEDLVFQAAPAIVGGREFYSRPVPAEQSLQQDSKLERGAIEEPGGYNNFQARYIIRHAWEGPIECSDPQRGIWGGPWPEVAQQGGSSQPIPAQDLAFVQRGAVLADYVTESAAERIAADVGPLPAGPIEPPLPDPRPGIRGGGGDDGGNGDAGCAHCTTSPVRQGLGVAGLGLVGLLGAIRLRRRRSEARG
jgi:MYXO-CTERM domain-containing protein